MVKKVSFYYAILMTLLMFSSCSNETEEEVEAEAESVLVLDTSLFSEYSRTSDFELVDCTLSDGTDTQCYKVVYYNEPEKWELGCPENEGEVGGLGVYDGNTNPGLRALDDELWVDMALDGYDIINDDGTINIVTVTDAPGGGGGPGGRSRFEDATSACLHAPLNDISMTYYIPAYPVKTNVSSTTSSLDYWGVSLDGFPYAEAPPSSIMNGAVAIPALDACGGHPQPDGPYHWHLVPQVVNNLLEQEGVTSVSCTDTEQTSNEIVGYARDGFPIYGYQDSDGSTPNDLDACNGHTAVTDEFPDGLYHYHITNVDVPNILPCTYGATVADYDFSSYN